MMRPYSHVRGAPFDASERNVNSCLYSYWILFNQYDVPTPNSLFSFFLTLFTCIHDLHSTCAVCMTLNTLPVYFLELALAGHYRME